jgi:hypothetical protein
MADLTPTRDDRFSFGLWTVGWQGVDVFGGAVGARLPPAERKTHHRHQPRARHQILVIEQRRSPSTMR